VTTRKHVLTAVAFGAAALTSSGVLAPAEATPVQAAPLPPDSEGCVHYWEFTHVNVGNKKFFVHEVWDTPGTRYMTNNTNGHLTESRYYNSCQLVDRTYITATFRWDGSNWRLKTKDWTRW
jgi:hypothetical protein